MLEAVLFWWAVSATIALVLVVLVLPGMAAENRRMRLFFEKASTIYVTGADVPAPPKTNARVTWLDTSVHGFGQRYNLIPEVSAPARWWPVGDALPAEEVGSGRRRAMLTAGDAGTGVFSFHVTYLAPDYRRTIADIEQTHDVEAAAAHMARLPYRLHHDFAWIAGNLVQVLEDQRLAYAAPSNPDDVDASPSDGADHPSGVSLYDVIARDLTRDYDVHPVAEPEDPPRRPTLSGAAPPRVVDLD